MDLTPASDSCPESLYDTMSFLANTPNIQPDAAFSQIAAFNADTNEQKVDLCPGFYRDDDAKPWILPSVAQVIIYAPHVALIHRV